jgi:hypothetical protein
MNCHLVGTELQFEKMDKLWRWLVQLSCNNMTTLPPLSCTLQIVKVVNLCYAYFVIIKKSTYKFL